VRGGGETNVLGNVDIAIRVLDRQVAESVRTENIGRDIKTIDSLLPNRHGLARFIQHKCTRGWLRRMSQESDDWRSGRDGQEPIEEIRLDAFRLE
jgi:hypothetical protein